MYAVPCVRHWTYAWKRDHLADGHAGRLRLKKNVLCGCAAESCHFFEGVWQRRSQGYAACLSEIAEEWQFRLVLRPDTIALSKRP